MVTKKTGIHTASGLSDVTQRAKTSRQATQRHAEWMTAPAMGDTVGVIQAAEILKVHPKTIERLIHECQLPAARIGRAYVMMTRDVLRYAQDCITRQTAERMRR